MSFTNGPVPRRVPQTRLARVQWRARKQARRIQTWQGEIRQSYGRVYSSADLSKIRDALVYALSGLNRFLLGGRSLAEKEAALIGWAAGPTGANTLPELRDRGRRGHVEDHGLRLEFLENRPGDCLRCDASDRPAIRGPRRIRTTC